MHLLYNKQSEHSVTAAADGHGVFAWVADTPRLLQVLTNDLLLMAALERKFVRALVQKRSKRPIFFFPGFASTQLIAWKAKKCVGTTCVPPTGGALDTAKTALMLLCVAPTGSKSATGCGSTSKRCCTTTFLKSAAGSTACPSTSLSRLTQSTASCGPRKVRSEGEGTVRQARRPGGNLWLHLHGPRDERHL